MYFYYLSCQCKILLDHLPHITLQKRTDPTNEMFVVALLTEIMRHLVPNHTDFRAKISYAAFLFQLMVGDDYDHYPIFDIFHKVRYFIYLCGVVKQFGIVKNYVCL